MCSESYPDIVMTRIGTSAGCRHSWEEIMRKFSLNFALFFGFKISLEEFIDVMYKILSFFLHFKILGYYFTPLYSLLKPAIIEKPYKKTNILISHKICAACIFPYELNSRRTCDVSLVIQLKWTLFGRSTQTETYYLALILRMSSTKLFIWLCLPRNLLPSVVYCRLVFNFFKI